MASRGKGRSSGRGKGTRTNSKNSKNANSRVPNSPRTKTRKINKANRQMLFRKMHNKNAANRYTNALHRYTVKDLEKMTNAQINGLHEVDQDMKDKLKLWKREKKTIPGVLKYLGISPEHAVLLADANITYEKLKHIDRADLIDIGFKVGPAIKIVNWQKTADNLSAAVHAPSFFVKQFATGSLGSPPTAPVLKRNNTISYELYQELTDKGDETRKIEMDRAMQPLTSIHLDGLLRLETEGAHVFRIGEDKDVYFNWVNTAGKRQFHVSLHNSKAPKFSNRLSAERQEVGSLHVKQDISVGGGGGGGGAVRRILINYNLTTRQYEVSIDNENTESTESIDELARQVVRAFREYYAPRNHRSR
jgi:hypothetical protein